jgi:hypothetical protein
MEEAITSSHSKLCMIDDKFANVNNLIFNENLTMLLLNLVKKNSYLDGFS